MSLQYISQQITIYGGSFLFVTGLIGNSINIFIFLSIPTYRKKPCVFYFIIAAIVNNIYILFNFTTRVIGSIYGVDYTSISILWCKIRQFLVVGFTLITLTCSCVSIIDQYIVTSQNIYIRRYSNIKLAHRIVLIIIIICFVHAIPCLLYYDISSITNKCGVVNPSYGIYTRIYIPTCLFCIIPIIIMIVFGCLIYRNICQTQALLRQQANRQVVQMTLFQIILFIMSLLPYGIFSTYKLVTEQIIKDSNQILRENLVMTIVTIVTYCYYAVCLFNF